MIDNVVENIIEEIISADSAPKKLNYSVRKLNLEVPKEGTTAGQVL